jgi:hypothetical protein
MSCDYYIEKSLVFDYLSSKGEICKTSIIIKREKCFIDSNINPEKYIEKLTKKMKKKCYIKILYEKNKWSKSKYQKKYESYLGNMYFPIIKELNKVYINSNAFKIDS